MEQVVRIVLFFDPCQAIIVGAVSGGYPIAFFFRHEVHVGTLRSVWSRGLEKRAGPSNAPLIVFPLVPSPVHIEHKLCVSMTISHGIRWNAIGCACNEPDQDLALRRGQLASELDHRIQRAIAEFCEIMGFPVVSRARRKQRVKSFLPLGVWLSTDVFTVRRAKAEQRLNQFPTFSSIPNVEDAEQDHLLAMHISGKKWHGRSLTQSSPHVELLRCGFYKFAILCQHLFCLVERENDQPAQDFRTQLMKFKFELGNNRKVTATAANCPKQVGVFVFAGSDPLAVRGDYLNRDQI